MLRTEPLLARTRCIFYITPFYVDARSFNCSARHIAQRDTPFDVVAFNFIAGVDGLNEDHIGIATALF